MLDLSLLTLRNLLLWVGAWTVISAVVMGEDKHQAIIQRGLRHKERISERTLHELAFVGGFLGIIIGAEVFRHKTAKSSFWPPVILAVILWSILLYYVVS